MPVSTLFCVLILRLGFGWAYVSPIGNEKSGIAYHSRARLLNRGTTTEMPQVVTYAELQRFSAETDPGLIKESHQSFSVRPYSTFLSHSSRDDHLIPGVLTILTNHGATVYVDDMDESLPENPSPETANILRTQIRRCKRFVLFVTENTKSSRWVPWELGLGDGMKTDKSVAVFPSAERNDQILWSQQEYLGLYRSVVWSKLGDGTKPEWIVYNHNNNQGQKLREWLTSQ